jgi:hypothetical protein
LIWIGDEIVSINGQSVKGLTKVQTAKLIQTCEVCLFLSSIEFICYDFFLVGSHNSL